MKIIRFSLIWFALLSSLSCEIDNIGPLIDENTKPFVVFNKTEIAVGEYISEPIIIEVSATFLAQPTTIKPVFGGDATEGVDYTIVQGKELNFDAGSSIEHIIILLIDNRNYNDDHTITISLPDDLALPTKESATFKLNITNDDLSAGTVTSSITESSDDAEEGITGNSPGNMDITSSDLEFGEIEGSTRGVQYVGLRYNQINIPKGAKILRAKINLVVDETVDNPQNVVYDIFGEATDNSSTFTEDDFNISTRPLTDTKVTWDIPVWSAVGTNQTSVDIKEIIQEIINRNGWEFGNSLNLIFKPDENTLLNPVESGRVAEANDGDGGPILTIDWEL
jgi:hypothetical protein